VAKEAMGVKEVKEAIAMRALHKEVNALYES
jgi:hypothetical protein